jgi:tetratricopeptide (TPR) repeat protein
MEHSFHKWDRTKAINLPVSKEVYNKFLNEEMALSNEFKSLIPFTAENYSDSSKYPKEIIFNVNSYYSGPGQKRGEMLYGLRTQDLMVLDIVKTNNWERPICFPIMSDSRSRIGLDNYLRMEGLVYRLTPFNLNTRGTYLNAKILYEQLSKEPEGFSQEPALGFKFRNLNMTRLYFDENAMRTAQIYRHIYLTLADYFTNYTKNPAKAAEVINIMRKKIVEPPVTMETRTRLNLLILYNRINQKEDAEKIFLDLERENLDEIERNPSNVNTQDNPYETLIGVYELLKKYDKEIELYYRLQKLFPNDEGLKNRIAQLKVLAAQNQYIPDTVKK